MKRTHTLLFFASLLLSISPICAGQLTSASGKQTELTRGDHPASRPVAQSRIQGVVSGPKGPLPGAIIQVNGTTALTVSRAEGKFNLEVPNAGGTVMVTCTFAGLEDVVMKLPANTTNAVIQFEKRMPITTAEPELESGWW